MSDIVRLTATNGRQVEFINEIKARGGMKDIYFAPDKSYVICLLREPANDETRARLEEICGTYRKRIFEQDGGDYLRQLYYWPEAVVEYDNRLGVVVPFYDSNFYFKYGSRNNDSMLKIRGEEKNGRWFISANNRNRFIDPRELGEWSNFIKICVKLARAVRRMHMAGLSHSDLSYKNCLIDPITGSFALTDLDGLVVPHKHPPIVLGTPEFFAPEVLITSHLDHKDPKRILPSRKTDLHALAVLIYMYLFCRHPLKGSKIHDPDGNQDEFLMMGEKALFIEHPSDHSNHIDHEQVPEKLLPWQSTKKLPYTIAGPYLAELFLRAFVDGLHNPNKRPSADEWEQALIKTVDLIQPCHNSECEQKWYIFNNKTVPTCPFCGTQYQEKLPVLNLYSRHHDGNYRPDNHRLMVYSGQSFFKWHINTRYYPNEKIAPADAKRVGYFVLHRNEWYLVNENMPDLTEIVGSQKKTIAIGDKVALREGTQLLLDKSSTGRLVAVQMSGKK